MAKNDNDLFERLRRVGIRKQVAKTLSEIGEGAGKKARNAAHSAVSELRSVADEIERRMPGTTSTASARSTTRSGTARTSARASRRSSATASSGRSTRTAAAKPRASRSRSTASPASRSRRTAATRTPARASGAKPAAAPKANGARAPRGQNKAKILASLKSGPKTASVIAKETGIGTGTVGSTLSKLATSGEVVKAARGYGLPSK